MSYSFYLFDVGDGDSLAAAHAWLDAQERAAVDGIPAAEPAPAWAGRLRALLLRRHPELQPEGVLASVSRAPYAQLADAASGAQVRLYGGSVAVTIPFWHAGPGAEQVLRRVAAYLATIRQATGFVVYDPQQDAVLDIATGLPGVAERYNRDMQTVRGIAAQQPRRTRSTGRRRTQARSQPTVDERLRDPAAWGAWLAGMDGALPRLLALLPPEVAEQLDYTPGSLDALEQWILARYERVDQVFATQEALLHEALARYVGETIRRTAGGEWSIAFDDPKNAYHGVPVVRTGRAAVVAPKYLISASVDRRTGRYLSTVARNLAGDEPQRNPNT